MKNILPVLFLFVSISCFSQWSADPSQNNYIALGGAAHRYDPVVTTDGRGGAIVAYVATENGTKDIYIERIDSAGNLLWGDLGVGEAVVTGDANTQFITPHIISDGHGGAIIAFHKYAQASQTVTLALQRYDSSGLAKWPAGGVYVNPAGKQELSYLLEDDNGGAIITWLHSSIDDGSEIRAQHITAAGNLTWPSTTGTLVRARDSSGGAGNIHVAKDGTGGVYVAWNDSRFNKFKQGSGIYVQRILPGGGTVYQPGGDGIYNPDGSGNGIDSFFNLADIAASGTGGIGIVLIKQDFFTVQGVGCYTYFDNSGTTTFNAKPLGALQNGYSTADIRIVATTPGRFVTVYQTTLNGSNNYLYSQSFDASQNVYWSDAPVCILPMANPNSVQMLNKGDGTAYMTWIDRRTGGFDIYAQAINSQGHVLGDADGVPITNNYAMQQFSTDRLGGQVAITGKQNAIVVWEDSRVPNVAIYGSLLGSVTTLPVNLLSFTGAQVKNANLLTWVTTNEVNNAGFNIQRCSNGTTFTNIGYTPADNSGNAQHTYSFLDERPLTGTNYYRLVQLDKDGRTHYSKVITLKQPGMVVTLSPNPVAGLLKISNVVAGSKIKIADAGGKVLKIIIATSTEVTVDVSNLATGLYYCNTGITTARFVKAGH